MDIAKGNLIMYLVERAQDDVYALARLQSAMRGDGNGGLADIAILDAIATPNELPRLF